jgi:hypothetical protein
MDSSTWYCRDSKAINGINLRDPEHYIWRYVGVGMCFACLFAGLFSDPLRAQSVYSKPIRFSWRNKFVKAAWEYLRTFPSVSTRVRSCLSVFCRLSFVLLCSVVHQYSVVYHLSCCVQLSINILSSITCPAVFRCPSIFCRLSLVLLCSGVHQYSVLYHLSCCVQLSINILSSVTYPAVFSCPSIFCRLSHVLLCSVFHQYSVVCHMTCCVQLSINILSSITCPSVFSCPSIFCRLSHILLCSVVHQYSVVCHMSCCVQLSINILFSVTWPAVFSYSCLGIGILTVAIAYFSVLFSAKHLCDN